MSAAIAPARHTAQILLVEDNDNDAELTRISMRKASFPFVIHHVENGEHCLDYLHKEGRYADAPTPDVVLLDLNMPRMGGLEVLEHIRKNQALTEIPVIVLSSSEADKDISLSYELNCSAYLIKPVDLNQFATTVSTLSDYWRQLLRHDTGGAGDL